MAHQYAALDPNGERALLAHSGTVDTAETRRVVAVDGAMSVASFQLAQAINVVSSTYGDTISIIQKQKSLLKFGRNTNVGSATTGFTIWYTGQDEANETYPADNTNPIDHYSSSSTADTQILSIEGHTDSGGTKTFVSQAGTLNGQNAVALTTPLNRMTRIVNNGSVSFTGEVYGYEGTAISSGKPSDTTKIHATVPAGKNQSEKASTSLSSQDYWIVTNFYGNMLEKSTNLFADVELQWRPSGGVFRPVADVAITSGINSDLKFDPYVIFPTNSDVRLVAVGNATGMDISGGIQGYLAIVV